MVRAASTTTLPARVDTGAVEAVTAPQPGAAPAKQPVLRFGSLPLFVEEFVLPNWRHRVRSDSPWCARWWEHAEAVGRLTALWEAFEVLRTEPPPAISIWWLEHFGPHMAALTSDNGTFAQCSLDERGRAQFHRQQPVWASETAPVGLFPVTAAAQITTTSHPAREGDE